MLKLQEALAAFTDWMAAGRPGGPEALLAAHPELRDLLEAMLTDPDVADAAIATEASSPRRIGDYELLEELGRGGMGVVYRARQRSLDREVALKVLPAHVTLQPQAVARFRREATLAARLEHPNIVAVYAVGNEQGAHFFAMERIDGAPIARIDPTTGRARSVRSLVEMAVALCDALEHAHQEGVLHRDVKPSNILVRRDGSPALTDFGLARDTTWLGITPSGAYAGTPHYMAPEQIKDSSRIDARADVWGLAATMYELLAERRPFEGNDTAQVFERIATTDPPDLLHVLPDLAPDLAAIVMKGLEKRLERRYASAAAFGADLRAFLEFRPITARRTTLAKRGMRWLHHHPAWRAALLSILVAVVLGPVAISLAIAAERDRAVLAELAERDKAYEASMRAAVTALQAGDRVEAERLLESCPPELRRFEWHHAALGLDTSLLCMKADDAAITAVALDANAHTLAAGSERGGLAVWSVADGTLRWRRPPEPDGAPIDLIAIAADGDLVIATRDGRLRRHSGPAGEVLAAHNEPMRSHSVAMAADLATVLVSPTPARFERLDARTFAVLAQHELLADQDRPQGSFLDGGTT
ncbi:MAG: protein kinase, partial [Planctomycetes bacterium]|nr:protein kinase [Planctomycetota bacterium]